MKFPDTERPVLTCPDDQMLVVPDGQLNAAVTWPAPQVTDNSGEDLEAFPSQDNGTVFGIGEGTTVVYNATDSAGNTGYCNFSVIVIGTLADRPWKKSVIPRLSLCEIHYYSAQICLAQKIYA